MEREASTTVSVRYARSHFAQLLKRIESGAEITITKRGAPVAKMVPLKRQSTPEERREAIAQWRESSKGLSLRGLRIRELIDEGR